MRWRTKRRTPVEIAPDEIFLDDSNAAQFDRSRFEGRLERPLAESTFYTLGILIGFIIVTLTVRAGYLQVVQGTTFAARSADNSLEATELFAPRGVIADRNGVALARNADKEGGGTAREYTLPSMGQIIGYVSHPKKDASGKYYDLEQRGIAGLEAVYNDHLQGENGRVLIEKDALGGIRSSGTVVTTREGQMLELAIDAAVQKSLAEAISSTAEEKGFIAGAGVILEVNTGEVLAIVSYPSYDPNVMSAGGPAETIASYNASGGHPFLDHAVQGVYAPGSIVKPFISAGALTDGIVTRDTVINDPGSISLPDPYNPGKTYTFRGWRALGPMTVESAIAWSSDIYYYTVGGGYGGIKGLGIDRLAYWYYQFGFGSPTGIDLPEEASGRVPTPEWKERTLDEQWYLADTYFTAIGQYATQVTPVQAARATAAVANGGKLVTPTLKKRDPNAPLPAWPVVAVRPDTLPIVRSGMRQTVTSALAQQLNVPYVTVAGKTGTAETGTRNQYDNSWIVGFFPYEAPKYAFAVVLERGPAGSGSQAVNAMRNFLDLLHADDSPYLR
jgi:penicillin-binding protein 2